MLVTVYDKNGKPIQVEGVDAREYVASGEYTNEPPAKKEAKPKSEDPLTVDQLKAELGKLKVEFPATAKKEDLEKLLAEKQEADKAGNK